MHVITKLIELDDHVHKLAAKEQHKRRSKDPERNAVMKYKIYRCSRIIRWMPFFAHALHSDKITRKFSCHSSNQKLLEASLQHQVKCTLLHTNLARFLALSRAVLPVLSHARCVLLSEIHVSCRKT